jgi:cell division GTPase FtsZ
MIKNKLEKDECEMQELKEVKTSITKFQNRYFLEIYTEKKIGSELFKLMWVGKVPKKIIKGLIEPFKRPCEINIDLGYGAQHTPILNKKKE